MDFGLARVTSSGATTLNAGPVGTLIYMSPEQVRNEPLDRRTDVWSLGVVFAEMLSGRHPFERDNMSAVLMAILEQPPPVENLDPALAAIVCRALAKDRAHRYADCREMLADLEICKPAADTLPQPPASRDPKLSSRDLKKYLEHASSSRAMAPIERARRGAVEFIAAFLLLAAISLLIPSVRQRAASLLSRSGGTETHMTTSATIPPARPSQRALWTA